MCVCVCAVTSAVTLLYDHPRGIPGRCVHVVVAGVAAVPVPTVLPGLSLGRGGRHHHGGVQLLLQEEEEGEY